MIAIGFYPIHSIMSMFLYHVNILLSYPFNHVNVLIESFYCSFECSISRLRERRYPRLWLVLYLSKRTSIIRLSYFCASLLEFYASISSFREIKIVTQLRSEVWVRRTLSNIAKNNTYVEQVMPKLFGWCQAVFTELHSYLIPARGNGVPHVWFWQGGRRPPGKKGGGTAFPRVPPGKHHWLCEHILLTSCWNSACYKSAAGLLQLVHFYVCCNFSAPIYFKVTTFLMLVSMKINKPRWKNVKGWNE
jgi:hypothetical protein